MNTSKKIIMTLSVLFSFNAIFGMEKLCPSGSYNNPGGSSSPEPNGVAVNPALGEQLLLQKDEKIKPEQSGAQSEISQFDAEPNEPNEPN